MALFAIGDTHLSLGCDKPMDVFAGWQGYVEKLKSNWENHVTDDDTVVVAGDISWAMKLENCYDDFAFIHGLPGRKIFLKGNHDYWWTTRSKMEKYVFENGFSSISFLHNNCFLVDDAVVCGTRSWMYDGDTTHDQKVMDRETGRLRSSLAMAEEKFPGIEKIVFLHYPPVYQDREAEEITECLSEFGVRRCYYGHLHGEAKKYALKGEHKGVSYKLISADSLGFSPFEIC